MKKLLFAAVILMSACGYKSVSGSTDNADSTTVDSVVVDSVVTDSIVLN